jgi:1-aminocyclopropane-1-carboxylate deaminase/D-cysteine desulfhydrase-like pyridoxal-dependent ACC family enzyme/GNAT superfamily N-acetyltransferase
MRVCWQSELQLDVSRIVELLQEFGSLLPDPLSERLDLDAYARKILAHADIAFAFIDKTIVGMVVLYANDTETRAAHVPMITVAPFARRKGVGVALMSRAMALARQRKMHSLNLTVLKENSAAIAMYRGLRFRDVSRDGARIVLQAELPPTRDPASVLPTALEPCPELAAAFGLDIDLKVKRDDLYPMSGGGIKARKIQYILQDAVTKGHDVIVTNGGPQSNHARATAVEAARLGLKCHIIVVMEPGRSYPDAGNILLMRLSGATLEYRRKDQLARAMDRAVSAYAEGGFNPLYLWGGGHCLPGTVAFAEAATEAQRQTPAWSPDFLILASGTGSTQAGLAIGYAHLKTRVIGISVARDAARGGAIVRDSVEEYRNAFKMPTSPSVEFMDDWVDGGYEQAGEALLEITRTAARVGMFLDTTYSGKGWHGFVGLVKQGLIPAGSKVLFWHTGGLMNLQAGPLRGRDNSL